MKNTVRVKIRIIALLLLTAALSLLLVAFNAYSSKLQYEINNINAKTQENSYKAANLQVKIQSATNVNNLEDRAFEMGLVYPTFDNIVCLKSSEDTVTDLAMALRQNGNH